MITASRIEVADMAEEFSAGMALRLANTKEELISVWWREADHFQDDARRRLQDIYADKLAQFAPMQRAG